MIKDLTEAYKEYPNWACQTCGIVLNKDYIDAKLAELDDFINSLNFCDPIQSWEEALATLESVLHPNNYLCMKIKRTLIQLYGNKNKFELPEDLPKVRRKIELCQNYLDVYTKVDDGYSAWRGKVLEELVSPMMLQSQYLLQNNLMDKESYVTKYKNCIRMIKEASKCRQYEQQSSANLYAWFLKEINDVICNT